MAQLEYIRFDTDFFDKPKIKGLVRRHGQDGVNLLIRLLCAMGRATDGAISRDAWEFIGEEADVTVERTEQIIDYCLEQHILGGDKNSLTNARIQTDQEALERKRDSTRNRVKQYRDKQRPAETQVITVPERAVARISPAPYVPYVPPADVIRPKAVEEKFDTSDPNMEIALEKLQAPAGQDWTYDNRYMGAGRRPMKDYPEIWLTPQELADVIKKLEGSDIPVQSYKDLFLKAEAKLKTYSSQGRSNQTVSVYNWLTGFLFDESLERAIKETRLAKTLEGPQRYEQRR